MSYLKEFQAAASRTRKLGLDDVSLGRDGLVLDGAVLDAVETTGHIPFAQRADNGFNVNFGMFHMLAKKFHIPGATMTIGNVAVHGKMRFPATPAHFRKMVENQTGEENMGNYHLWTTLPGGYILDHAILSSLHKDGLAVIDETVPAQRFLYGLGDELEHGLTYHPMLVGLEFFVASATLDREALEYLMGERFPKQYS
ncbi:hypothetical protein GM415_00810 [Pseudodesulfovibrio cashew]|uniref:Uncharacterized protein n=1 Tax=Pseudodesulfovibrio cashew TaxID=2678688 RepID=A0A6I6JC86_9BACT|nr:hypothetical protein [Pseudodesulfovibrio cashew]QGY38739.1 hypothetical protein GM415_00810 [Pseudodesulfovibrio cashew]